MRIDVIHLRGLQQRGDGRPGPAAAMAAREERIFSCDGLWPDRPLDDVGIISSAKIRSPCLIFSSNIIGQWLQFEADLAHPLRHQRAVEIDAITCIDRFLPVQREPVGIFGHRDVGEKRFDLCPRRPAV
jgi:hypothetical protein